MITSQRHQCLLTRMWIQRVFQKWANTPVSIVSYFEHHYPSLSKSTKEEKNEKKYVSKVKSASFNSVGMRTRAQKGTSKIGLAAIE